MQYYIYPQNDLFVHTKQSESLHIAMLNTQQIQNCFFYVLK